MLVAFGADDLQRLAIPVGVAIAGALYLFIPSWRDGVSHSYEAGRSARQRNPGLARLADIVGVLLLIGTAVWLVYGRG